MSKSELAKLVDDTQLPELQKVDKFVAFINQEPPAEWLEDHPMAKGVKYLPIGKTELLLDKIFQQWRVEILREGQLLNSIYCTVRLHYKHPVTSEWTFQDGTGAVPAKTDKDARASDMTAIKSDAVATGLPAAKSFAIKDAADHIGKIFGRDVNRKGNLVFSGSYALSEQDELIEAFKSAKSEADITQLLKQLDPTARRAFTPVAENRLKELRNANNS